MESSRSESLRLRRIDALQFRQHVEVAIDGHEEMDVRVLHDSRMQGLELLRLNSWLTGC